MLSAAAILGVLSFVMVLAFSFHTLRRLGADEIAFALVGVAVLGFLAAIAGALIG